MDSSIPSIFPAMGSHGEEMNGAAAGGTVHQRKLRFLCLHGFRTSGEIMRKQIGRWPDEITSRLDLVFPDGQFPARGKSTVEGIFPPPYYEWFQYNPATNTCTNLDEAIEHVEQLMIKHGPFDGLLGFAQGAILTGALVGLQEKGLALTALPKLKYFVIISGGKIKVPEVAERAYPSSKIDCKSLHFIGDTDPHKETSEKLMELFVDPVVIRHPKGHIVPRIDEKSLSIMLDFLQKMESELGKDAMPQDACKAE